MKLCRNLIIKALSLLLAVLFVSAIFSACGKVADTSSMTVEELLAQEETAKEKELHKKTKKLLLGEWTAERDFTKDFEALNFEVKEPQIITVKFTFTDDYKYQSKMDEEQFRTLFKKVLWDSFSALGDGVNSGPEYIEDIFKQYNNMTADEYVDIILKDANTRWNTEKEYKLHGDKLYILNTVTKKYTQCDYKFTENNDLVITENGVKYTYTKSDK